MEDFRTALHHKPLLFDGAMGSLLYERGIFLNRSYDELNLSRPALIRAVHRDYLNAGADILETNTFGANRMALAKHGLSESAVAINRAGVEIARSVADDRAYICGAVGPTGVAFQVATEAERQSAADAHREQLETLVEGGVNLLCFETFYSILELEQALSLRAEIAPDVPVVAMMVFDHEGVTEGKLDPTTVASRLIKAGADVVGANCGCGPPELYEVGAKMVGNGAPVAIMPNAGLPNIVEGRTIYVANPEHFGVFARRLLKVGVRIIGGCCGTTPEHTRSMLGAVRMIGASSSPVADEVEADSIDAVVVEPPSPAVDLAQRSKLGKRLADGEFIVSVELTAPPSTDVTRFLDKIRQCQQAGIDIVNVADGPRATARMSNLAACGIARAATGIEPILHVCCRDRNYLGLISHLIGAQGLDLNNLVIITGDPPKMGDYPFATPVYDVDSIGLLGMAAHLNAGIDPAGKEIANATTFVLATGAEPAATDYEREIRRLELKCKAGAELIMTQPVYDPETLERFLDDVRYIGVPIMVGLLPLASHRNAEFLHNEVPGMQIPERYRERMANVGSGPEAQAEGVQIAQEALVAVADRVAGAYIMPPFNRVEAAISLLDVVKGSIWQPHVESESL